METGSLAARSPAPAQSSVRFRAGVAAHCVVTNVASCRRMSGATAPRGSPTSCYGTDIVLFSAIAPGIYTPEGLTDAVPANMTPGGRRGTTRMDGSRAERLWETSGATRDPLPPFCCCIQFRCYLSPSVSYGSQCSDYPKEREPQYVVPPHCQYRRASMEVNECGPSAVSFRRA
jgi:hypothetical protein